MRRRQDKKLEWIFANDCREKSKTESMMKRPVDGKEERENTWKRKESAGKDGGELPFIRA